jgi:hydrogenase maturation factor
MGAFQGKVTRIEDGEVWAEIADLAVDQDFPCRWVGTNLEVGDFVLVINIDGAQEDLVIVGKMNGEIE